MGQLYCVAEDDCELWSASQMLALQASVTMPRLYELGIEPVASTVATELDLTPGPRVLF